LKDFYLNFTPLNVNLTEIDQANLFEINYSSKPIALLKGK